MAYKEFESKVDRITRNYVSQRQNLALAIGVVEQGHHYIKGFGKFSDTDDSLPNPGTIYEIGSVTKLFTGIVLAKLENDKTVNLDDSIRLYLPQEVISQLNAAVQSITLRQLATHTSGLPRFPETFLAAIQDRSNPYLHYTAPEMYADLAEVALSEPGKKYEYSNFGMGLLGHLLSLKTCQPYDKLVTEILCQPLSMTDTAIHLTPQQQQCLTPGHSPDGTQTSNWDFDVMAPCGAFRSTSEDLLKFLQANLCTANTEMAAILGRSQAQYFVEDETLSIGLAWHISTLPNGQVLYWHNGGTGGYTSFIGFDKIKQTGVAILSNYGDATNNDFSVDEMGITILMELASQ